MRYVDYNLIQLLLLILGEVCIQKRWLLNLSKNIN